MGCFFIFIVFTAQTEFNALFQNMQYKYCVLFFKLSLKVVLSSFKSNLLKLIFALNHNLNIPIQSFLFFFFFNLLIVHTRSRISHTTRSAHSKLCHIGIIIELSVKKQKCLCGGFYIYNPLLPNLRAIITPVTTVIV